MRLGKSTSESAFGKEIRFQEAFVFAILFHVALIGLLSVLGGQCGTADTEIPSARAVSLAFTPPAEREIVTGFEPEQSAPGSRVRDLLFRGTGGDEDTASLAKSDDTAADAVGSIPDEHFTPIPLSRDMASPQGREQRPDSPEIVTPGVTSPSRDVVTQPGSVDSPGRDAATVHEGRDGVSTSEQQRIGDQGLGVEGTVNVRGRRLVFKPTVELPPEYSQMGLSFTVEVEIVVGEEGLVSSARVVRSDGQPDLERRLVQAARRYRFEAVDGGGNQTGTITFVVRPE